MDQHWKKERKAGNVPPVWGAVVLSCLALGDFKVLFTGGQMGGVWWDESGAGRSGWGRAHIPPLPCPPHTKL